MSINSVNDCTESAATEIAQQGPDAIAALKKFVESKNVANKMLFPESDMGLCLLATLKRIAMKQPHYRTFVHLPYSERTSENTSFCLILPDLSRTKATKTNPDVEEESREWANILRKTHPQLDIKQINKIMTLTQLKRELSQAADKKKFSNSYDVFLIEAKIFKIVLSFIGCHFKTSTKRPLPVHATKKLFIKELARAYSKTSLPVEACKDTISVHVGNLSQSVEHLSENVNVVAQALLRNCPGGALNVRSVYLKADNVKVPLPLYVDFGSPNDVVISYTSGPASEVYEDECSTLPDDLVVRVHPDGRVAVVKKTTVTKAD